MIEYFLRIMEGLKIYLKWKYHIANNYETHNYLLRKIWKAKSNKI
jgi:hypothetical protein